MFERKRESGEQARRKCADALSRNNYYTSTEKFRTIKLARPMQLKRIQEKEVRKMETYIF